MSECSCSAATCDCPTVVGLQGEVDELKLALERVAAYHGRPAGLHYGRDGLGAIRSIAVEALRLQ